VTTCWPSWHSQPVQLAALAAELGRYWQATFPRSLANPTRSARQPIVSFLVRTGCCLSQMTAFENYSQCFLNNGGELPYLPQM